MRVFISSVSYCEYVIQQANALVGLGHDVMIMLPSRLVEVTVGSEVANLLDPGVAHYFYHTEERRSTGFYSDLFRTVKAFSPDIFHIHENGEMETLAILLRFSRIPLLVSKHDVTFHPGNDSLLYLRRKMIMTLLVKAADVVHVHGESLHDLILKTNPSAGKKCVVIPHGTLSLFKYWIKGAQSPDSLTCLFFGRMEKYRGLDNLLTIGGILKKTLPGIKIIVAGKGEELDKYKEQMTALGIFEIHDAFIPDEEVHKHFRRSSLLLLPYHEASQSGVVHTGITFGLPVVATAVGAIPEVIIDGKHGRLIAVSDMPSFADAVKGLLSDPCRLSLMKRACLELADQLEFTALVGQFVAAYRRAIGVYGD